MNVDFLICLPDSYLVIFDVLSVHQECFHCSKIFDVYSLCKAKGVEFNHLLLVKCSSPLEVLINEK